jgi:2-polyprenyl-6-methoxyphenol hydroxylase-like FAD-dependent oxidoreductase
VGGGIAGLSAAISLRRIGFDVAVYERAPELSEVGAGISLWANALRALDYIGAGNAVRAACMRMTQSELRTRRGFRVAGAFRADALEAYLRMSPAVAMIHRADLIAALVSCLPPGIARCGCECVSVEQRDNKAIVRFANQHVDEADVVIGADGIRSAVRTALFGQEEPRYAGYTCWRGVCPRPAAVPAGYFGEWWGRGQRFGITTLPGDRVYWFATRNAPSGETAPDQPAHVAELFGEWADPVPELIAATPDGKLLHNDIVDRPPMRIWSRGRIGLIGDAAHPTTPNLGQGGCMAIEDAVVLARSLHNTADVAGAIEAFTRERYPRTRRIAAESWRLGALGQRQGRLTCWMRDRMMRLMIGIFGSRDFIKHASFDVGPLPVTEVPARVSQ